MSENRKTKRRIKEMFQGKSLVGCGLDFAETHELLDRECWECGSNMTTQVFGWLFRVEEFCSEKCRSKYKNEVFGN